jgi:putative oxygen-independent coproporphyrinogen III oxidase
MAGIYLHIPFCKQKCHYCNFFSLASIKRKDEFVAILLKEIDLQKEYLQGETISTIYFGGGTPSLLSVETLQVLLEKLKHTFTISPDAEITLEANPDDLDPLYLASLKQTAINRLSIGIQSFHDADLEYLNRVHTADRAQQVIEQAQAAGFDKLTIDLIYGIPTLSKSGWIDNINAFLQMGISHLSAYALTVEPKTALHTRIQKGLMSAVDEMQAAEHFEILMDLMGAHGFVHYEISNFARPGHYSQHNSLYWLGGHYLGLGPSAHSYNGLSRQWNVSNLGQYLQLDTVSKLEPENEVLTKEQRFNEYVMTSLRTVWGCDLEHISNIFGTQWAEELAQKGKKFIERGHMFSKDGRFFLTKNGKLFADGIASELFV